MSAITVLIIKVLFLALLWLFILSAVSVIRTDLFGKPVSGPSPNVQHLQSPPPPPRKSRRQKGPPQRVTITNGDQAGESADLSDVVLIGRTPDCALILDDDYVSSRHARVVSNADGVYVEDLGSTNGTYVNGQRITAPTSVGLSDALRIGKTVLKLET